MCQSEVNEALRCFWWPHRNSRISLTQLDWLALWLKFIWDDVFKIHQMIVKIETCPFPSVWKILNMFVSIWSEPDFLVALVVELMMVQDIKFRFLQVCGNFSEAGPLVLIAFCSNSTLSSHSKACHSSGRPAGGSTELTSEVQLKRNKTKTKQEAH